MIFEPEDRFKSLKRWQILLQRRYQHIMDEITPYIWQRWTGTLILLVLFLLRVANLGGFYIVAYALGIYLLNLLIGFLSPQVDPEEDSALPTTMRVDDEFRPFIRHLSERKFWDSATRATTISFFATFIPFLNIPVFWPILVIYFVALTFVTLKNQIKHMIKHKYLPWSTGKKRYDKQFGGPLYAFRDSTSLEATY